jgi:hypothetical protein
MDNWEELWDTVQLVHPASPLAPKDLEIQLNNFRDKLLNLFENKVPAWPLAAVPQPLPDHCRRPRQQQPSWCCCSARLSLCWLLVFV